MAWSRATYMLALTALFTGSLNTISNKWVSNMSAEGSEVPGSIWGKLNNQNELYHTFDHPFFMAACMFVGESLCMLVHLYQTRLLSARTVTDDCQSAATTTQEVKDGAFWFALPAAMDIGGTGTMYCGLCLSSASVFQMLRGSVVIFTSILSVTWLKRKIHSFQWFAVALVAAGITIVGLSSVLGTSKSGDDGKDATSVLLGDVLIVLAQIMTALQMCTEEKLMAKYHTPTLKAIGMEGLFGLLFTCIALVPMYFIQIDGARFENVPDALAQLGNNPMMIFGLCCNMLSIAMFNNAGISVTRVLSATHRMVLDSVRTVIIWIVSLAIPGWEEINMWTLVMLVGFLMLAVGTGVYNEIIPMRFMFDYPTDHADTTSFIGGATDHGSFIAEHEPVKTRGTQQEPLAGNNNNAC
eukprot:TRINITY_DN7641_c0_g1_i1.p1 TRINITY_DN7641_c0_g1~~TRINITY_DN7641_c0_g1_i1.p1  ORF type:complete len:411 (-),score=78.82 TRINITY_DN7641_c0_g1_i1:382-1614(-)